jgi:hypothetical protein
MRQLIGVGTPRGPHERHLTVVATPWAMEVSLVHTSPGFHLVAGGRLPNELHGPDPVGSTEQQFVHAQWEALTSCEKEGPSCSRENCVVQWCLDS